MKIHSPLFLLTIAAVCFSNFAVTEAKFTPASFLTKRVGQPSKIGNNASSLSISDEASKVPAVSGGSDGAPSSQVTFSYWLDVVGSGVLAVFVYFWAKSISLENAGDTTYPYFNKSVLENGFCNKHFAPPSSQFLTQKICGITDFIMVGLSYLLAKSKGLENNSFYKVAALYTIVHGIVHYSVFLDPEVSSGPVNFAALAILGVIMIFAPLAIFNVFETAPKTKDKGLGLPVAGVAWAIFIAAYKFIFKQKQYALTYINCTIFLSLFGSRALLIGTSDPADIAAREEFNGRFPIFWVGQVATIVVLFILCSEPFACNGWFGELGGHLLFEFALYFYLMSSCIIGG